MKKYSVLTLLMMQISVGTLLLCATKSRAATPCDPWIARMESVQGNVEFLRAGQAQWQPASLNDIYCAGDRVQVGQHSRVDVYLANQSIIRLDQNTTITFGGLKEERTSLLQLIRGTLYFFSRLPRNLEILTAFVNAGVEGTEGLVSVQADRATILILEGNVLAQNQFGSLPLTGGQSAVAEQGTAPVLAVAVRPRDAVQWTLYYPPTLHFRADEFPAGPGWEGMVRSSIEAHLNGDLRAAFETIKGVPDSVNEPRFFAYRAALLLAVGRVEEASKDIERALSLRPAYSDALALRSVIAVAQNDNAQALESAKAAVTADAKSAAALIALSYAQQANFDLEGARDTLRDAVQFDPANALAWARLAELHMSFAELNDALHTAHRAAALDPNLSRTQTVLGFAYLTQINTAESKRAFSTALERDQADPLPRLGLGLAMIRESDFEEGRRQIDIAVSLDPNNSLMRSYLGKAYFEEKRNEQAATQYQIAKELDPKDPTPYFYDAIRKQTTNRPVEALQDMQKAIELNDNRAVYRSRLALDSDLAARSASLGRIFSDLGFQQLALVEGWKSVNTDPTNFSSHRLLADSYSILPRHEIARVSELLQSQLLQPLNTTPIQPRLAESNLFLISSAGPATLGFNEFNPLFTRNGINFQTTGLAGENHTYAGEGVLSGIYKNTSFSLGGFRFQTNGWRKNSDQKDFIGNAFLQMELSPRTSLQSEIRRRETKLGDIQQRFFAENVFPGQTDKSDELTVRLGGRHAISMNSIVLGSFVFQDTSFVSTDESPASLSELSLPQSSIGLEFQNIFRSYYFNVVTGFGYFDINGKFISFTEPSSPEDIRVDQSLRHFNVYSYANIHLRRDVTFTLGAAFDYLTGAAAAVPDKHLGQFNPKIGLTWNPFPDTSIRAAVFRSVKRTLITDQTLEPTQVSGFNQFYDDVDVTKSWNYGAAIDKKITKSFFTGGRFSVRRLTVPGIPISTPTETLIFKVREYLSHAYLFWTPYPWLALRGTYEFERFKDNPLIGEGGSLNTHRLPLGMIFIHPSGFGASLTMSYYHQTGRVISFDSGLLKRAKDNFWILDAAFNYRLPKRYGFVTVGASNLANKKFKYFDTDTNNPRIQPTRTAFLRLTLAFP